MNEKEKMLGGNPYRADDLLLMKERTKVRSEEHTSELQSQR